MNDERLQSPRPILNTNEGVVGPRRFRKLPVVVDAIQWTGTKNSWAAIKTFAGGLVRPAPRSSPASLEIDTLGGVMIARLDDWIIRGVEGEFYPCEDSIFRKTYLDSGPSFGTP